MSRLVTTVLLVEDVASESVGERIRKELASSKGVLSASFNISSKLATVLHDPEVAPPEGLIARIEMLGVRAQRPSHEMSGTRAAPQDSLIADRYVFVLGAVCSLLVIATGFVPRADLAEGLMLVLTVPVVFFIALPMLIGAFRRGTVSHDALTASASLIIFAISVVRTLTGTGRPYFDATAVMLTVSALGKYLEGLCIDRALLPLMNLEDAAPHCGRLVTGEGTREVLWDDLKPGQNVSIRAGERVPVDGVVVGGSSEVDESLLFGEGEPLAKEPGSTVYAGSVNRGGALTVRATATGSSTVYAARLAEAAGGAAGRSEIDVFAKKVAALFGFGVVAAAAGTAVAWSMVPDQRLSPVSIAIAAAAVLAAAAPVGVASAATVALVGAMGRASRYGIVVRTLGAFDVGSRIDLVCFNKSGTVTEGDPQVVQTVPVFEGSEAELLSLAAGIERESKHPFGRAVMAAAATRGLAIERPRDFRAMPGEGAMGDLSDGRAYVGTSQFLESKGIDLKGLPAEAAKLERRGLSSFFVAKGDRALGLIAVADQVREDATEAVDALKRQGVRVALLSGDNFRTTFAIAEKLGFPNVYAALTREEKEAEVRSLGSHAQSVAFVGSDVDISTVMERASLGIGVGPGSWGLSGAAQVILPSGTLAGVGRFLKIARRTARITQTNMFFGLFISSMAFPLAAILGVRAAPSGPYISLVPIAAAALAASTRIVSAFRGLAVTGLDADARKRGGAG